MSTAEKIIEYVSGHPLSSSLEIFENAEVVVSYATVRREIAKLVAEGVLLVAGNRKSSRYSVSPMLAMMQNIDIATYFERDIDDRDIFDCYNFDLIDTIANTPTIFTPEERRRLDSLQRRFAENIASLSGNALKKEMDRLGVDLSWKSSQIEGNTYSLLETERLLMERETAHGKTKDEAIMLLNHKEALDFIIDNPDYLINLSVARIENIHSILTKELNVDRNIRNRRVGITGTNYRPLDNEFTIRESLESACRLINNRDDVFEKALLLLLLILYIQPFNDGNKRTARITSNAILIANNYCPISFRSVDSIDYKKAMLLFYEQNNISAFKRIFCEQFEFAVNTYF